MSFPDRVDPTIFSRKKCRDCKIRNVYVVKQDPRDFIFSRYVAPSPALCNKCSLKRSDSRIIGCTRVSYH